MIVYSLQFFFLALRCWKYVRDVKTVVLIWWWDASGDWCSDFARKSLFFGSGF